MYYLGTTCNFLSHFLMYIHVDLYLKLGDLASVKGTPFDFLSPHTIGERYQEASDVGYDNNFCINATPTLESDPTLKYTAK